MKTLILSSNDLETILDLDLLRLQMRKALSSVSSGAIVNEPRHVTEMKNEKVLGFMPAYSCSTNLMGYKAVSVFPANRKFQINPHQGLMCLLCPETGQVNALMDGCILTALRTAAVSALATDVLSRRNSKTLSILGSGVQAREHIRALLKVREFEKINIFARSPEKIVKIKSEFNSVAEIEYHTSAEIAVANADVIVTCTSATQPIVDSMNFPEGVHVNAVGACRPNQREVRLRFDPFLRIYLDHYNSCIKESEEVFGSETKNFISTRILGELGEVLNEKKEGRLNNNDITFFKSVGLAAEDLFAAELFYDRAIQRSVGTYVQF